MPRPADEDEAPLRAELFSAAQMEQHGKALALSHSLAAGRAADQLLERLAANESALVGVCRLLTAAVTENRRITPAGEWLLDNFYLIEEQISTARRHLPKGYSRELPRLARGPSADCPRVYDIALEIIAHGDGRVDTESLSRFVAAYQTVTAAQAGRVVGHSDHAAAGADRESPARRGAHRRRLGRAKSGRFVGRPDDGDRRAGSRRA
jgi:cyclic beta-1,2-glucan synthetase